MSATPWPGCSRLVETAAVSPTANRRVGWSVGEVRDLRVT